MNFLLSEEQLQLQQQLEKRLAAVSDVRTLHAYIDGETAHFARVWRELVDFGAAGLCVGAEFGGLGLELIDMGLVAESLGRAGAPNPLLGHTLATIAIARGGSWEQKARWLPLLASGERLATVAFCEGGDRWLPQAWTLPAEGALTGAKQAVPNALEADLAVVGLAGGGLGVVELAAPGVGRQRAKPVDPTRALDTVSFDQVPFETLPNAPAAVDQVIDAGLVLLAADAFGGACRCIDMANAYVKEREQFGVKLAQFQAIRHQLANLLCEVEPCRGLYWYAAYAFDHVPDRARHVAAVAKQHITDRFLQVAREATELHGGIGYTWEYDIQIWFKRAMFDWAFLGNATQHRERAATLAGW